MDLKVMISQLVSDCEIEESWLDSEFKEEHAELFAERNCDRVVRNATSWEGWVSPLGVTMEGSLEEKGSYVFKTKLYVTF